MSIEQPRDANGQFISLEKYVETLVTGLYKELEHRQKALELQASEYSRRLEDLNHAHERAQKVQHTFLSINKYEDDTKAANAARELALQRVDEKVDALSKDLNRKLDDLAQSLDTRLKPLQEFKDKALGFGALVSIMSAVFGSLITALVIRMF